MRLVILRLLALLPFLSACSARPLDGPEDVRDIDSRAVPLSVLVCRDFQRRFMDACACDGRGPDEATCERSFFDRGSPDRVPFASCDEVTGLRSLDELIEDCYPVLVPARCGEGSDGEWHNFWPWACNGQLLPR